MEVPLKPQTTDDLTWLLTIVLITLLATCCAYLIKKMVSESKQKTSWLEQTVREIATQQLKQGFQIENLQKDLNNIGNILRSKHGTGSD